MVWRTQTTEKPYKRKDGTNRLTTPGFLLLFKVQQGGGVVAASSAAKNTFQQQTPNFSPHNERIGSHGWVMLLTTSDLPVVKIPGVLNRYRGSPS